VPANGGFRSEREVVAMKIGGSQPWWLREVVVPLALMGAVCLLVVFGHGDAIMLLPVVALATGWLIQPARLWPVWLGVILMVWVPNAVIELFNLDPHAFVEGETIWGFAFVVTFLMALLVLLPLWIGRVAGRYTDRRLRHRPT
jgi:hypothetical protein